MNGPDCERIGRSPAPQNRSELVSEQSQSRWYHSDPPLLLSPAPPSLCRTVWTNRTSIFYVMNANMPNFQTSQRSLGVHHWKRGKEALKGFLYGLRSWYGCRWKGHSVILSCRCCSFSRTLAILLRLYFFIALFFRASFFFLFPRLSHFLSYLCSLNFSIPLPLLHIFSSGRIRDKSQPCRKVPVVLLIKWERSFALSSLFRLLIADWLLLSLSSRLSSHYHLPSPSFSFLSRTLLILHHINLN